jgi:hypothetical protein
MSSAENATSNDVVHAKTSNQVATLGVEASELVDYTKADKVVFFAGSKSFELTVEDVPDWIQRMKKGESWFTLSPNMSDIKATWNLLSTYDPLVHTIMAPSILSTLAGAIIPMFILHPDPASTASVSAALTTAVLSLAGSTVLGVGGSIAIFATSSKFPKQKKAFKSSLAAFEKINREGLRNWLHARYNVTVKEDTLRYLLEIVENNELTARFIDVDSRGWMFSRHSSEPGWFVEPVVSTAVREASYVEVATMVEEKETGLPIEAAKLWESLQTSITKLSGESEVTAEHASLRIMEDARSAVQDYHRLVKLGGEVQGESVLVRVLTLLNTETSGLVQERIKRVVSNMEVQSEYLHTRQQHAGLHKNEHVQLPAIPEVEHLMETRKS